MRSANSDRKTVQKQLKDGGMERGYEYARYGSLCKMGRGKTADAGTAEAAYAGTIWNIL